MTEITNLEVLSLTNEVALDLEVLKLFDLDALSLLSNALSAGKLEALALG